MSVRNLLCHPGVVALVLVTLAVGLSERHLRVYELGKSAPSSAAVMVPASLFKVLTFGQWPAGVDWTWIRAIMDPDISKVKKGEHPELYYRFMMATELDPAFFYIYYGGGGLLAVIRDDGPGARDLVSRGNEFRKTTLPGLPARMREGPWRYSWQLPILLAYIHLFELNDIRAAGVAFVEAAAIPGAPNYLASLAHRFEKPGGEYEVGLRLINFMMTGEKDPRARASLEAKRKALFVGQFLFHLRASFTRFLSDDARYLASGRLSSAEMHKFWEKFRRAERVTEYDPLGGRLSLDESGRLTTSTPHDSVFGLE